MKYLYYIIEEYKRVQERRPVILTREFVLVVNDAKLFRINKFDPILKKK